jgi:hypothetical protein
MGRSVFASRLRRDKREGLADARFACQGEALRSLGEADRVIKKDPKPFFPPFPRSSQFPHVKTEETGEVEKIVKDSHEVS